MIEDTPVLTLLDSGLNVIVIDMPYSNLVWVDRYFDFGEFQAEVPARSFPLEASFAMVSRCRGLAQVQKVSYGSNDGNIVISGFLAEQALDRSIAWPRFKETGEVGSLCTTMLERYYNERTHGLRKMVASYDYLPIFEADYDAPTGRNYVADFVGDRLGTKMHRMLEDDGMSYRVNYERTRNRCRFEIVRGLDLTESNQGAFKQRVVSLSEQRGDIRNVTVTIDRSAERNIGIVAFDKNNETGLYGSNNIDETDAYVQGKASALYAESDGTGTADEMNAEASNKLDEMMEDNVEVIEIDADLADPSVLGGGDILGCMVTLKVEGMGYRADARVVEIGHVIKPGTHEVTIGFGTKRISNIQRAIGAAR